MVSYPGIDKDTLTQKKIYWIASLAVTSMILCLVLVYHLIFPQLRILIYYGLFIALVFMQGVILPVVVRQVSVWHRFVDQFLVAIATFVAILKMGGIPYSGGLIFVGLALVFFSLNFWKKSATIAIYVVYVITVILAGVLHPYLTVPPEMTPAVNISLYVVNLLWISGFATAFVLNFIAQRVRMEHLEAEQLKELDEAKSRFYTGITHEFRTPLTVIRGMTELIREDPERWLDEGLEKINIHTDILLNLVNQMLDLAKLEAGAMSVHMVRGDINLHIKYIIELFASVAAEKQIQLVYNPAAQPTVIDHDPEKLMQILINLLSNALKFTQHSGRVEVSTALTGDDRFEIRIADNGPGISGEHMPYIFDRFYRVEEGGARSLPGSGLGLALTRELVKLMKGTIWAESVYGEGTAFTVDLPATQTAPLVEIQELQDPGIGISTWISPAGPKFIPPSVHGNASANKPMLLIVEDHADVVQYLFTLLENEYDVVVANDGREGFEVATECIPDIILSDVMMPVMDGIQMLGKVKDDLRTSHIPVVMLTAKADIASRLEGLERGADAYIPKPFNRKELLVQLRSLIELRRKLRERYAPVADLTLPEVPDFRKEDVFMRKVRDIMIAHLTDDRFDIQGLCREIAMSRSQLYRKFKFLTDRTITQYLRSLRLHKAKELLLGSDITVSEAAYRTGFKNISHFSKAFTREFSVNPSDIGRK